MGLVSRFGWWIVRRAVYRSAARLDARLTVRPFAEGLTTEIIGDSVSLDRKRVAEIFQREIEAIPLTIVEEIRSQKTWRDAASARLLRRYDPSAALTEVFNMASVKMAEEKAKVGGVGLTGKQLAALEYQKKDLARRLAAQSRH